MIRTQLNLRVSGQLESERAIDEKRIELRPWLGAIPSRPDVLRLAPAACPGVSFGEPEADHLATGSAARSKAR